VLRKRIIFTLLYDDGNFVYSRNFRLQKVGSLDWLRKNYDFSKVAFYIDELVILDISRGRRDPDRFGDTLRTIAQECFVPIAAGGGIDSTDAALKLLRSGADKIVMNTVLSENRSIINLLVHEFGRQCIVGSIDFKKNDLGDYQIVTRNGTCIHAESAKTSLLDLPLDSVGEVYLNSIDRDGTGQGLDFGLIEQLPPKLDVPIILAGGVGNAAHLLEGLQDERLDAVATANLFNFVGDGLKVARQLVNEKQNLLAHWPSRQQAEITLKTTL
jgi:cyclase